MNIRIVLNLLLYLGSLIITDYIPAASAASSPNDNHTIHTAIVAANAIHVEQKPIVDGDVLGDPVWKDAMPLTDFWQTMPDEGQPCSEKTDVRIMYTDEVLYVGAVCYDRNPKGIIVSDSRRDASLDETDCFRFILDTYHDGQNGFIFGTNPAGIQFDGQITNEGVGSLTFLSRQQAGSGSGLNLNWDGSWQVRTLTSDFGWSMEFAIPFRTIRFPTTKEQIWGINFQRNIRRKNEKAYWARLPRQYDLYRVSHAGTLNGLKIPTPRNLYAIPFLLSQSSRDFTRVSSKATSKTELGTDLKYSITPSLTLDFSYNTDFAQVEVDEIQINLDRFNLFFPEKRPFFLENAGLFSVGDPSEVELFFSRRIGIGPDEQEVPILGGLRLSGQVSGIGVGLLNMQTQPLESDSIHANNFTVARVRKELPNRSAVGMLVTNRVGSGKFSQTHDQNQTYAVDGRLGIGKYGLLSGFAALTSTPGTTRDNHSYSLTAVYNSATWMFDTGFQQVEPNFDPELGFLKRESYRKGTVRVLYRYRPENLLGLLELRPHAQYRGFWNFDNFLETGYLHIDNHWEWRNGYEVHTGINFTTEGVTEPFEISDDVFIPIGTYNHREAQLVFRTDQGKPLSYQNRANIGGFFGGKRVSSTSTLKVRVGGAFTTQFVWQVNKVRLPWGRFTATLFRSRISYSFNTRVLIQSLIQYDSREDLWSTNLRFSWLHTANTGFFIVLNQTNEDDTMLRGLSNRSVVLKYNHIFDLLK